MCGVVREWRVAVKVGNLWWEWCNERTGRVG